MEQGNRPGPGRPPGSPNKITAEIRSVLSAWVETEMQNIPELYAKLSPKEKAKFLTNVLSFVVPKMRETDLSISSIPGDQINTIIQRLLDEQY